MTESMLTVLRNAWTEFADGVIVFLPHLLATLCIIVLGWLVAWFISVVSRQVLRMARFDHLADRIGLTDTLRKVALPKATELAASMAFWLVWLGFLTVALTTLGFSGMDDLTARFIAYLPRVAVSVGILMVGMIAANFAWRATLLAAVNSDLPSARLLSGGVRWLIGALVVVAALEQLGVAKTMMLTAFAIAFGALMLGVGLAIGIGGGPIARRILERQFPDPPGEGAPSKADQSHL